MIAAMPAASPSTAVVPTSGVASVDGLDGGFAGVLASELPVSLPGQPGGIETGDVQGEVSGPAGGPLVEPSLGNPASAELAWYALTGGLPAGVVQGGVQPGLLGSSSPTCANAARATRPSWDGRNLVPPLTGCSVSKAIFSCFSNRYHALTSSTVAYSVGCGGVNSPRFPGCFTTSGAPLRESRADTSMITKRRMVFR